MMIGTKDLKKLTLDIILEKNILDNSDYKMIHLYKNNEEYTFFSGLIFLKPGHDLEKKYNYYITYSLYDATTTFDEIAIHSKWFNNRRLIFTDNIKKYFMYKEYFKFANKYNFNCNEYYYSYYC